jgi:hypothetical protein
MDKAAGSSNTFHSILGRADCGIQDDDDPVLIYYLLRSNVDKERFDTTMTITACIHQLTNARSQLKDVLKDAKSNGPFYEVEVATA